jgi:hypothetical protein
MRDYPTLHLCLIVSHVHLHPYPFLLQAVPLLKCMSKCNKEQLVVRKDMDVNEHERLSNITLRHTFK